MGGFTWSVSKNASLRQERQVSFEKLVQSVECGGLIADQEDFARPGQRRLAIFYDSYAWVVPYVAEQDGTKFLKMAYPSRKLFKRYCDDKKLPNNYLSLWIRKKDSSWKLMKRKAGSTVIYIRRRMEANFLSDA